MLKITNNDRLLVIWYDPHNKVYYYKLVSGFYTLLKCGRDYEVGYTNDYGHIIILTIDIYLSFYKKPTLKNKVLTKLISFLQKINK